MQDAIEQGVYHVDRAARKAASQGTDDGPEVDMDLVIMTLAEVAAAMEFLHVHRITHRDLKPKNILLKSSDKDRRGFCAKVGRGGIGMSCVRHILHAPPSSL